MNFNEMKSLNPTVCIACSIFKKEVELLKQKNHLNLPVTFLDSMMHLEPEKLHRLLETHLVEAQKKGNQVLLLFGECHPFAQEQSSLPGVSRTNGNNCIEILLGKKRYRELRKKGYFFLLPDWALKWKETYLTNPTQKGENSLELMAEKHSKLVYLDTGLTPVPKDDLKAFSEYSGLPWEVMKVNLEPLKKAIRESLDKLTGLENQLNRHKN